MSFRRIRLEIRAPERDRSPTMRDQSAKQRRGIIGGEALDDRPHGNGSGDHCSPEAGCRNEEAASGEVDVGHQAAASSRWSARRSARATIVSVGVADPAVVNTELPAM